MVIFMCIYAILAVEYFAGLGQDFGHWPEGTYVTYSTNYAGLVTNHSIDAETGRGFIYGWEYYGSFSRAIFTLFQVMTGESWSEAIARPILFGSGGSAVFTGFYFVSFILLTQIVLTNVVVAVLLDKFVEPSDDAPDPAKDEPRPQIDAMSFLANAPASAPSPAMPPAAPSAPLPLPAPAQLPAPLPKISSTDPTMAAVSAVPTASIDEKLGMLLSEMQSLRASVSRCEKRLDKLYQNGVNAELRSVREGGPDA